MSSKLQIGNVQDKDIDLNTSIENDCRPITSLIAPNGAELLGSMVLSDISEIIMGQSPAGDACNTSGEGVPLLNGPTEFGSQYPKPVQYTVDVRKQANKGDLLFCVRGSTTGRMNWADQTYAIGRGLAAIRGKNGYPNSFVRAVIEYKLESLLVQATGSTFPNVGRDQLNGLEFPPVEKTAAIQIASILDPIDDRIAILRETNATLEAIAQALFKSWFVDFDPVHANAGTQAPSLPPEIQALFPATFTDTPQGPIPQGWKLSRLGEITERITKGTTPTTLKKAFTESGINFIKVESITEMGDFIPEKFAYIDEETNQLLKRSQLNVGDVLVTIAGTIGRIAEVTEDIIPANTNQAVALIRPIPKNLPSGLIRRFLQLSDAKQKMGERVVQAVQANLSLGSLSDMAVVVPPQEVVSQLYDFGFATIDNSKNNNLRHMRTLSSLRDSLLPRLISGQLRLPEAEQAISAITD